MVKLPVALASHGLITIVVRPASAPVGVKLTLVGLVLKTSVLVSWAPLES